jgi:CSLREA domain-containing protein
VRYLRRLLAISFFAASAAMGSTYVVNDLGDASDAVPGDDACATAGAVCTLRAAIEEANAHAGPDVINFSVAGTISPATDLPLITQQTTIDGTTAPGYAGVPVVIVDGITMGGVGFDFDLGSSGSLLDGIHVMGFVDVGVQIDSDNVTVRRSYVGDVAMAVNQNGTGVFVGGNNNIIGQAGFGNVISGNANGGIFVSGAPVTIQGNIIGLNPAGSVGVGNGAEGIYLDGGSGHTIGGPNPGEGNIISFNGSLGILSDGSTNGTIAGNIVGLDAGGTTILGNGADGIGVGDGVNMIVGLPGGGMNVVSGNSFTGITVAGGSNNIVQNNRVGTDAAGTTGLGNLDTGILSLATDALTIRSNLVGANGFHGIEVTFGSTNNVVHSNIIGRSLDLTMTIPNIGNGVNICDSVSGTVVGSVALGGNVLSGNTVAGIGLEVGTLLGNTFAANSIYDNEQLGIDIDVDGVTANDAMDPDTGGNNLQNYPVVTWAASNGTQTSIQGTLNSTASTTFDLHFYSSPAADPSGFGEGQTYLGTTSVVTNGSGDATFNFSGPNVAAGQVVTATATGPDGTSEFSEAESVVTAPTVQFAAATFMTGEGAVNATITVTRTGDLSGISTVTYTTSDGTAVAPGDYTATTGTLTFNPTEAAASFNIPIVNDGIDEADETVILTLSAPAGASLGAPATATLTLTDDDPPPSISINDVTLAEGNAGTTAFTFTLTLSSASGLPVSVDFATADNSALAASDYTAASGTRTFAPGITVQTVTVNVAGDLTTEPNETFFVNLTNPVNATISDNQGLGTINNDDGIPSITINDVTAAEGNAGTTTFTFTITLSNPSSSTVTVDFATADGTATGSDYTATSGTRTFTPGVLTQTVDVIVAGDTTVEPNETFFVNLTNATNAVIADNQGVGTISNDDAAATGADVSITMTAVQVYLQLNYTIVVTNNGPGAATGVTVNHNTPAQSVVASVSTTIGTCNAGPPVSCTIPSLASGQSATINFVLTMAAPTLNPNVATVSANETDPDLTNNTASAPLLVPTLSEWLLIALAGVLLVIAIRRL